MISALLLSSPDYKTFLKRTIEKQSHVKAIHSKLAEAAGCQKSYLSKALHGEAQLMPEHVFGIAEYLGLSEPESDYLLELLQLDRAGSVKLRDRQKRKLAKLKAQMENLHNRFRSESLSEEEQQKIYYSSWVYSALHMACGINRLATPAALSTRFGLALPQINTVLGELAAMNLVAEKNGKWERKSAQVHVPFGSPMNGVNHCNWSIKALQDIQLQREQSLHYTAIYSLEKTDAEKLKHLLITAIERSRELVIPSKDEELVCLRLDLFRP